MARTAPAPCPVGYDYQCEGFDPGYLAAGALRNVIQRLSRGGAPVKIATLPPLSTSPYYGSGAIAW